MTGTSNLKKLEGRFTVRVELSDADVDAVIRQVILAKKPDDWSKGMIFCITVEFYAILCLLASFLMLNGLK